MYFSTFDAFPFTLLDLASSLRREFWIRHGMSWNGTSMMNHRSAAKLTGDLVEVIELVLATCSHGVRYGA